MMTKLRETRLLLSMTLDALEARTGLDKAHLSRIERGLIVPRETTRKRIARALGLSADSLFDDDGGGCNA